MSGVRHQSPITVMYSRFERLYWHPPKISTEHVQQTSKNHRLSSVLLACLSHMLSRYFGGMPHTSLPSPWWETGVGWILVATQLIISLWPSSLCFKAKSCEKFEPVRKCGCLRESIKTDWKVCLLHWFICFICLYLALSVELCESCGRSRML